MKKETKVKTCEEYVLQQLSNAEEKVAELQAQLESLYNDRCELEKGYKEISDEYDTLRKSLYESLIEVARTELSYLKFKGEYTYLYGDDPNYPVIKEAIDSWAKRDRWARENNTYIE